MKSWDLELESLLQHIREEIGSKSLLNLVRFEAIGDLSWNPFWGYAGGPFSIAD
jgi:hypothetical protein